MFIQEEPRDPKSGRQTTAGKDNHRDSVSGETFRIEDSPNLFWESFWDLHRNHEDDGSRGERDQGRAERETLFSKEPPGERPIRTASRRIKLQNVIWDSAIASITNLEGSRDPPSEQLPLGSH